MVLSLRLNTTPRPTLSLSLGGLGFRVLEFRGLGFRDESAELWGIGEAVQSLWEVACLAAGRFCQMSPQDPRPSVFLPRYRQTLFELLRPLLYDYDLRFRAQRATLHACQNQRSFDLPLQLLLTLHSVRPCTPGSGGCSYANLDLIVFVATGLDITSKDLSGTCIWNNPLQMGNPLTASVQHLYIVVLDVVTALFLAASCVRFSRTGAVVLNPKP